MQMLYPGVLISRSKNIVEEQLVYADLIEHYARCAALIGPVHETLCRATRWLD